MAKATIHIEKQTPNPVEEQAQAIQKLLVSVAESQDALIVFLDVLKELHTFGILDAMRGLLKNRHQVGVIAITQLNQPGMHHMMKNAMNAMQFLSQLEPNKLQSIMNALASGMQQFSPAEKPPGLWGMGKALRDPEVMLSMSTMLNFLHGMGEALHQDQKSVH
jgi:uncharacterized protein YjgD (DUF1641 family)